MSIFCLNETKYFPSMRQIFSMSNFFLDLAIFLGYFGSYFSLDVVRELLSFIVVVVGVVCELLTFIVVVVAVVCELLSFIVVVTGVVSNLLSCMVILDDGGIRVDDTPVVFNSCS